jgi:hypothetical protein
MMAMTTDNSSENDDSLRALLREWKPEASLPPHFQDQVWRRIERAEAAPGPSLTFASAFANWIANRLPRPALATAYVTLLLVIGAGAGWSQAQSKTARITSELSARYAQSVDPYQPTRQP